VRAVRLGLVSVVMLLPFLSGCSAYGQYCDAVEKAQPQLLDFGKKSTKAFAEYSKLSQQIADVAPEDVADDWTAIAKATGEVAAEHRSAHIDLADMDDSAMTGSLTRDQIKALNQAYLNFNDTQQARKTVVADVLERCKIDLAEKEK